LKRNHINPHKKRLTHLREKRTMSVNCPFCNIATGKAAASIVYEDAAIISFLDLNPTNVGHTLVVPKQHWENIYEIPEDVLAEVAAVAKRVSAAVKKTVGAGGISILQLNGRAAGQSVMHFHVHVIPRFIGDPISTAIGAMVGHHGSIKPTKKELENIAYKIQKNL
jgi:histidine triad (HIT) family protein